MPLKKSTHFLLVRFQDIEKLNVCIQPTIFNQKFPFTPILSPLLQEMFESLSPSMLLNPFLFSLTVWHFEASCLLCPSSLRNSSLGFCDGTHMASNAIFMLMSLIFYCQPRDSPFELQMLRINPSLDTFIWTSHMLLQLTEFLIFSLYPSLLWAFPSLSMHLSNPGTSDSSSIPFFL